MQRNCCTLVNSCWTGPLANDRLYLGYMLGLPLGKCATCFLKCFPPPHFSFTESHLPGAVLGRPDCYRTDPETGGAARPIRQSDPASVPTRAYRNSHSCQRSGTEAPSWEGGPSTAQQIVQTSILRQLTLSLILV